MEQYLERQRQIVEYRPSTYKEDYETIVNKIKQDSIRDYDEHIDGIKDALANNHLSVINDLLDLEMLSYTAIKDINKSTIISPNIKNHVFDIINNNVDQIKSLQDLYYLKNFGTKDVDYYKIQNMVEDMTDKLIEEQSKEFNSINYEILNTDTKLNYMIKQYAVGKNEGYVKIYNVLKDNVPRDTVYKYTEDELETLKSYTELKEEELGIMKDKYIHLSFDESFMATLEVLFNARKRINENIAILRDKESSIRKQGSELLSYNNLKFNASAKDLMKFIELEKIHFDSFMELLGSYIQSESRLYSFK